RDMRNNNRNGRRQILIAAASAALTIGVASNAATVTWNNATPPGMWSNAANWTGGTGIPVAADSVIFGATGSATAAATLTNEVDQNFTISTIQYAQKDNLVPAQYHTTQIDNGVTLSVTGTGTSFFVGTGLGDDTAAQVNTTITGAGALSVNNTAATFSVRPAMSTNNAGPAGLNAFL